MISLKNIRRIISKDVLLLSKIYEKYGNNIEIKFSNYGFIVVPLGKKYVYKYYITEDYFKKNNLIMKFICNFHYKEFNNYLSIKESGLLTPEYMPCGYVFIGFYKFFMIKISNIRIEKPRSGSFKDFKMSDLSLALKKIHNINKGFIHGNIHNSNFFILKGELGVFDFVNYGPGDIEFDISRVFTCLKYDIYLFRDFLNFYGFNSINFNKLYFYIKRNLLDDGDESEIIKISKEYLFLLKLLKNDI